MQDFVFSRRRRFGIGFLAGLIAGIVASGLMLLLNVTLNGVSLPQVLSSALTQLIPPSGFDFLFRTVGSNAKHYLFYGIFVGQCLVFALCGGLCNLLVAGRAKEKGHEQLGWLSGVMLAVVLWLATGLLFLPLTQAGVFGSLLTIGVFNTMLSLAVVGLVFSLLFVYIQNWLVLRVVRKQAGNELSEREALRMYERRTILRRGIIALGAGIVGVLGWRFISQGLGGSAGSASSSGSIIQDYKSQISPPPTPNYDPNFASVSGLSPEVTSNDQYYVVSKNVFSDPSVDAAGWHLTVDGEVEHPFSVSYNELLAMPMQKQYESMMCISNEVGGQYMSNGLWEGVRLETLLNRAGVKAGATKVVLYAADDYSDSIHLAKALEPTTLVAVHMNGQKLPQGHGYPARLLVPGIYGMKHVKWVTHIQVIDTDFRGYWQQRGWSDAAPIRMTSRIDTPLPGTALTAEKPTYIAGVAFSGNQGISEVDVSLDNGQTWQRAMLKKPLSALSWVLWQLPWTPSKGSYTIIVRAVDLKGKVQAPYLAPPLPDGSSGYHSVDVTVS